MGRFFKKSEHIDTITTKEIDQFLNDEDLKGKVTPAVVKDFYNSLSSVLGNEDIRLEDIDYSQFGCKNAKDEDIVNKKRDSELNFVKKVNKDILTSGRLLKAATALAHKYENKGTLQGEDINSYLRFFFRHHEKDEGEGEPTTFKDMLDLDVFFLRYLALLSDKKAFAKTGTRMVKDISGKTVKHSQMEDFSDMFNMDLIDSVSPDFQKRLATKDLYVKNRFNKIERSQNLIILVDDSGSMSDPVKKGMLQAAITLKLRDFSPNHNIYIGTFEMDLYGFMKVEKETRFKDLTHITLSKGITDVNGCVKKTIEQIKDRKLKNIKPGGEELPLSNDHFEILVINDGQDDVDHTYHPTIKIHALCLMESNNDLKNICHRSSGTYHYLTHD